MDNNDILRRIRYIFNISDAKMMETFAITGFHATRTQISDWLKKDDDPAFKKCNDQQLAIFLDGFIAMRRGKREGQQTLPEKRLSNNIILRKLKIALNMKDDDLLQALAAADFRLSKHELSAFFRKKDHKHYRECKDQVLRNVLKGLQARFRDKPAGDSKNVWGS